GRRGDRLVEVPEDVLHVLEAHRDADEVGPDAAGDELLRGELAVRGRGRVQDEGARVPDVRQVRGELQVLDHPLARGAGRGRLVLGARVLPRRSYAEGEDGAGAERQVLRSALVVRMG